MSSVVRLYGWTTAIVLAGSAPSLALATPARQEALLSNPAFLDDAEVLLYPSYVAGTDAGATLTYDAAGSVDASFSLDDDQLIWIGRGVPTSLTAGLPSSPWQFVYAKANGGTGMLLRSSWQPNAFSVGGAWSRGDFERTGDSFAVGGDLRAYGALDGEGPDTEFGLDLDVRSRSLGQSSMQGWVGRFSHDTSSENTLVGGFYSIGPRVSSGAFRAALVAEPGVFLGHRKKDTSLQFQLPGLTLSAEVEMNDWMVIRGGAQSRWLLAVADAGKFTKSDEWSSTQSAMLGVGFKKEGVGRLDGSINPAWLVNGPHVLSGVPGSTFMQLSAQANF